jgi:hypothetical protein
MVVWQQPPNRVGNGTWALSLAGEPKWRELQPDGRVATRAHQASAYDPVRHRLILSGGRDVFVTGIVKVLSMWWPLEIDVRPGNPQNVINLSAHGVVKVALLGSEVLDVRTLDPKGVEFAGASPFLVRGVPKTFIGDVDGDGDEDLVLWFETDRLELAEGDTVATATAALTGGRLGARGSDRVRIVSGHAAASAGRRDDGAMATPGISGDAGVRGPAIDALTRGPSSVSVAFRLLQSGDVRLALMDVAGRRITERRIVGLEAGEHRTELPVTGLAQGVYFVTLRQGVTLVSRRVALVP